MQGHVRYGRISRKNSITTRPDRSAIRTTRRRHRPARSGAPPTAVAPCRPCAVPQAWRAAEACAAQNRIRHGRAVRDTARDIHAGVVLRGFGSGQGRAPTFRGRNRSALRHRAGARRSLRKPVGSDMAAGSMSSGTGACPGTCAVGQRGVPDMRICICPGGLEQSTG